MVGIVIVSHSLKLAEGVVDFVREMAKECPIAIAAGGVDGSYGTSLELIESAIDSVMSGEGVIVLVDMGSSILTTEMAIETRGTDKIKLADAPLVEGAMAASIDSQMGMSMNDILIDLEQIWTERKHDY